MMKNWKTTAAGAAAVLVAFADVLHQASTGEWDPNRLMADFGAVSAGVVGLFAKDHDVK